MAQQVASAGQAAAPRGISRSQATRTITVTTYLLPALVGMFLVNVLPIVYNAYMSLTNRNGPTRFAEGKYQVVGFDNYVRLLSQSDFYIVFFKTMLYAAICVALFFVVGLAFALILNHPAIRARATASRASERGGSIMPINPANTRSCSTLASG